MHNCGPKSIYLLYISEFNEPHSLKYHRYFFTLTKKVFTQHMGRAKDLTTIEKTIIQNLVAKRWKTADIARSIDRSEKAVRFFRKTLEGQIDANSRENCGRKKKLSDRDIRRIIVFVKKDRFVTASQVQAELMLHHISTKTIKRYIRKDGRFESYWAARKPLITKTNRQKRLIWASEHLHWTPAQWRRVMWTDESPYVLRYDGKVRVWRMHNERYETRCTKATVKHDKKINVWGAFAAHGVGILHRIHGIMVKEMYHDILGNVMLPSADILFGRENYIFQQDNDPKHTANINKAFIVDNQIPTFDWPAQSPDLNPIENVWSILDQKCKDRRPNNEDELFQELQHAWNNLPVDLLTELVDSMPHRCAQVIAAKGGPNKY